MSAPTSRHRLAEIGALLADPARSGILLALMDGSARPAGELGELTRIAPATVSAHLRKLVDGGLLAVHAQGRHRYFRIADDDIAHLIESLALASARTPIAVPSPTVGDSALRRARTCYRHIAGTFGVALFDGLRESNALRLDSDALRLTPGGASRLTALRLFEADDPIVSLAGRACVDWTERRFHLAGALGTALAQRLFDARWLTRRRDTRSLALGPRGREGLHALGIDWQRLGTDR